MYLFPLVFPLLLILPSTQSACINCGGADKTSAKRLKMPNKSVFTRLAGIELMEIFEITNQINHEVCAQQCDAHAECAVFEFNLPNKLCVLASEYARLTEDLAKGAFETIVFVKVRGKFTKALPKDKETCLDKSEYEDYVKHEVDKWLKPSPKKNSIETSPASPTTVSEPSQTSGSTSVTSTSTTTTAGTAGTTTGTSSSTSKGSGGETTTGMGSRAESTESTTKMTSSSTSETPTTSTSASQPSPSTMTSTAKTVLTEPVKTTTPAGTTPTTTKDLGTTSTTTASTPAAVPPTVPSSTSSSSTTRSDPSTTLTTVSKQDEVKRSSSTQSITDEGTTIDEVPTTQETTMEESEEPSTAESSPGVEEPSTTTIYVEEVSTTAEPEDDDTKLGEELGGEVKDPFAKGLIGRWQIKLAVDGSNLRAREIGRGYVENWGERDVEMSYLEDYWTYWNIEERTDRRGRKKIIFKSMHQYFDRFLRADKSGLANLRGVFADEWEHWTVYDNGDHTWSFLSSHKTWLTVGEGGKVMVSEKRSDRDRFLLELKG